MYRFAMILSCCLSLCLLLVTTPAAASHTAPDINVLGFSPDGRFFAFEQSGMDTNTGIAFADLFVTDTKDNSWAIGTPVRIRNHKDQGGIAQALNILHNQTQRLVRRLGLNRASAGVAFVPKTSNQILLTLPWGEKDLIQLHTRADIEAEGCEIPASGLAGNLQGFYITMQRPTEISVLHSDKEIPRSRGCARSYAFQSTYIKPRGNEIVIAIILSYDEQTTSNDTQPRFIAITKVIKAPGGS